MTRPNKLHLIGTVFLLAFGLVGLAGPVAAQSYHDNPFANPERVRIIGYSDHAMEPFLSRDGSILFFNNRNEPAEQTDIHFATRVDDLTFEYQGRLRGAFVEGTLDGVPTMDRDGNFYFVSLRALGEGWVSLFHGRFDGTEVRGTSVLPGISRHQTFWVNFDVEVSANGNSLFFVDGLFRPILRGWRHANLSLAVRDGDGNFSRHPRADEIMAAVNTDDWEYAAAISEDELELIFTRVRGWGPFARFSTWRTMRADLESPFGEPARIEAITGIAEAATFAPGGRAIYFHKKDGDRFEIYRLTR